MHMMYADTFQVRYLIFCLADDGSSSLLAAHNNGIVTPDLATKVIEGWRSTYL